MKASTFPALVAGLGLGAVLLAGCTAEATTAATTTPSAASAPAHWSYEGEDGPDHWADLTSENALCGTGTAQSPVDLPVIDAEPTSTFAVDSVPLPATPVDNGHTVQLVAEEAAASTIVFDDDEYALLQTHYHTPAEHTIGGEQADAEFHFVHQNDDGELLVLGVLAREGAASAAWDPYIAAVAGDEDPAELDVTALLPASLAHYAYEGSLTTPPCTEDVQWLVLSTPVELSAAQIGALADVHDDIARPVQPLGDRTVEIGTGVLGIED